MAGSGAEELTAILNDTFTSLLDVALAAGGDLLKFGGDALCLLFDGPEHAPRAVGAAVEMRAALRARGPVVTERGAVTLRMSQGVHSGVFRVMTTGALQRELLVIGPDVTRTLEMETAANAGEILVSPETASQIPVDVLGRVKGEGILVRRAPPSSPPPELPPPRSRRVRSSCSSPRALRTRLTGEHDEPEHRHVTIGFVHFGATDDVFEQLGAEELAARLAELTRLVEEQAARYDICLLATDVAGGGGKFILTAGAPDAGADGEGRMLRTVLGILDAEPPLPVRAGVHSGPVFAGAVGSPTRRTYTVMGDAVNLAARLMARAEPGTCVASRTVLEAALTEFDVLPLAPFYVKGKRRPVDACQVLAVRETAPSRQRHDLAFVGRRHEFEVLRAPARRRRRRARLGDRARRRHRCRQEPPGVGARDAARRHACAATALRTVPERPCVLRVEPHPARGLRHPERLGLGDCGRAPPGTRRAGRARDAAVAAARRGGDRRGSRADPGRRPVGTPVPHRPPARGRRHHRGERARRNPPRS